MGVPAQTGVSASVGRALGHPLIFALAPLVAIRLRWAHLEYLKKTPIFHTLIGDSARYDAWGMQLAGGDWLWGREAFYQDPLYPYFLGVLYKLFGHDIALVRTVQVGLSAATCVLVGLIARKLSGPAAGTLAAFAWAFFRPDIFNTGELDKTVLTGFLIAAGLLAMLGEGWRSRGAAGLLFGLAALARGNLLAIAPVVALVYLWPDRALWKRPLELAKSRGGSTALVFLGAFGLALMPPTARNHAVSGLPVLTTGLGPNFFIGNSEWSNTGYYELLPFVRPEAEFEETDFHLEAERRTGRAMDAREVSSYWFGQGLDFIAQHPLVSAGRFARRLWLVGNDHEVTDMIDQTMVARYSPVLRLPMFSVGWFVPLALLGVWAGRKNQQARLLALWTLTMAAGLAAFFILGRYRAAIMPAVVPLAVLGAGQLLEWARGRDWRRLGAGVAVVAALTAICFGEQPRARVVRALAPLNVAGIFGEAGNYAEAEALLNHAVSLAPDQPAPWCALGMHFAFFKRWRQAREATDRCLAADQRYRGAYLLLGRVEEAEGDVEGARAAYQKQLELIPGEQEAAARLSSLDARIEVEPAPKPTTPAPAQ